MTTATLFPYRTINTSKCNVEVAHVAPLDITVDAGKRRLFSAEPLNGLVEIRYKISLPISEVTPCLPPGSSVESLVNLGVRAVSVKSRFRQYFRAADVVISRVRAGDAGFLDGQVSVVLDCAMCRGKVILEPLVILDQNLQRGGWSEERAFAKGSILGAMEEWEVIFDVGEPPPGRGIPIRWTSFKVHFSESPDRHSNLFSIEKGPIILLNSDIDGLHQTLHSLAKRGPIARVRDMVYHQIVLQAWTSLIGSTLQAYQRAMTDHAGSSAVYILDELEGWKRQVMLDWVTYLAGNADVPDALESLKQTLAESNGDLMTDVVPSAIQSRFKTSKSFDGMMKEFSNRLQGESHD